MYGIGVMLHHMCGGDDHADVIERAKGGKISSLAIVENRLAIGMADGSSYELVDKGQSCCERRHMSTDDDLGFFVGGSLVDIVVSRSGERTCDGGEVAECCFVDVVTSKGTFTVVNHNEHNGYYGGFAIGFEEVGR